MKKGALYLVCLLLIGTLLAGCGKKPETSADVTSADASQTSISTLEASSADGDTSIDTSLPDGQTDSSAVPASSSAASVTSAPARDASSAAPDTAAPEPAPDPTTAPPAQQPEEPQPARISVTLSVDCRTAVEAGYADAVEVAADGEILTGAQVMLEEGATVYDLLLHSGLDVEIDSTIIGRYVREIQFLKDKQCGLSSGWMYSVNGVFPGKSCDKYKLKDGDVVAWRYTCANGSDLK